MASAATTLLCAARFLARGGGNWPAGEGKGGFRSFVRQIARRQGHTPAALDRAEKSLTQRGLLKRGGSRSAAPLQKKQVILHPTLVLTAKGTKVSKRACPGVSLQPWKNDEFGGGAPPATSVRFTVRRASRNVTTRGAQSRLVLVVDGELFVPPPGAQVDVELAADNLERAVAAVAQLDRRLDLVRVLEAVQGHLQRMPAPEARIPVQGEAEAPGTFGASVVGEPGER